MPWSASGREMHEKLLVIQSNVNSLIDESKRILQPLLEASGNSISDESTIGSIIDDLGKLTSIEHHIPNGSLSDIKFTDSGIFSKSIIPSNVVMYGSTRAVFIEEGLLYLIDFDIETFQTTSQKILRFENIWKLSDNEQLRLYVGDNGIWVIPIHGNEIILLYGDGLTSDGKIRSKSIPIFQNITIHDFKVVGSNIAFISSENVYYYMDEIINDRNYFMDEWKMIYPYFNVNVICDGDLNYVASSDGQIYHINREEEKFEYITDVCNHSQYEEHYTYKAEYPDYFKPIISFCRNGCRFSFLEQSNRLFTVEYFYDDLDNDVEFAVMELPVSLKEGTLVCNKLSEYERIIIHGIDVDNNAVAYSFRNEFSSIDMITIGDIDTPKFVNFGVSDIGGVMIGIYETIIKASDHYTEEEIMEKGYKDYIYSSMVMRMGSYADYQFSFGPEFNPLFVPNQILSEGQNTLVTGKSTLSPMFNVAVTTDHKHWKIVNIDSSLAINVQDCASGSNQYVMAGLSSRYILVSDYGFNWERIEIGENEDSIISVVYSDHYNKFFLYSLSGNNIYAYNPENKSVYKFASLNFNGREIVGMKIMCYKHIIFIHVKIDGDDKVYQYQDILMNGKYTFGIKNFKLMYNGHKYEDVSIILRDIITIGDDIISLYELDVNWNPDSDNEYEKTLKTGLAVLHSHGDIDMNDVLITADEPINGFFFPVNSNNPITAMLYLNHLVVIHSHDKYYVNNIDTFTPICYGENHLGKLFGIVVNAKTGVVLDGYIHLIQAHVDRYLRNSYIQSSSVAYDPMVTESDLYINKKASIIKEFALKDSISEIDKNGNIDAYNTNIYKVDSNSTSGSVICVDGKLIKLASGTSYIYQSFDEQGTRWKSYKLPLNGTWMDIAYGNGIYVILRYVSSALTELYTSHDLITWTKDTTMSIRPYSGIQFIEGYFLMTGIMNSDTNIYYSKTGIGWSTFNTPYKVDKLRYIRDGKIVAFSTSKILSSHVVLSISDLDLGVYEDCPLDIESDTIDIARTSIGYLYLSKDGTVRYSNGDNNIIAHYNEEPKSMISYIDRYHRNVVLLYSEYSNVIFIDFFDEKFHLGFNKLKVSDDLIGVKPIHYMNERLYVGLSNMEVIDLRDTYPDIINGSFEVASGKTHTEYLPFTPDHVFLFGVKNAVESDRFLLGEIHKKEEIVINGNPYNSITFFNNTNNSIAYRSDVGNMILVNEFTFTNDTLNDRVINYTAIKENHYE